MAESENGTPASAQSFTFPAMTLGTTTAPIPGLFIGVSRILGIATTTPGGVQGTPSIRSILGPAVGASTGSVVILNSTSGTDTSVYTLWWFNDLGSGLVGGV